jgi:hypothetical protein
MLVPNINGTVSVTLQQRELKSLNKQYTVSILQMFALLAHNSLCTMIVPHLTVLQFYQASKAYDYIALFKRNSSAAYNSCVLWTVGAFISCCLAAKAGLILRGLCLNFAHIF